MVLSELVDEGSIPMAQEFLEILKNLSKLLPYFEIFGNTADSSMQALCNGMICAGESKRDDVLRTDPRGNIFVKLTIVPYSIQYRMAFLYCLDSCVGGIRESSSSS